MARLEIPALYRLDLGSSTWAWYKMSDLVTAVYLLLERLPNELFPELDNLEIDTARPTRNHIERVKGKRLLKQFGHLHNERRMGWSDEVEIGFDDIDKIPWDRPNLFVPAEWGLAVIESVLEHSNSFNIWALFDMHGACLSEREKLVISLRLGKETGKRESLLDVAQMVHTTRDRIRQIEAKAIRKLRHAANKASGPSSEQGKVPLAPHALDSDSLNNFEFTVRSFNCLSNAEINTVGELRQKTLADMLKLRNFNKRCARDISDVMLSRGVDLGWFKIVPGQTE